MLSTNRAPCQIGQCIRSHWFRSEFSSYLTFVMKSMIADFKQSMRKLRTKPGEAFVKHGLALGKVWEKSATQLTNYNQQIGQLVEYCQKQRSSYKHSPIAFSSFPPVACATAPQDQRISRAWNLVCCCQGFQMSSSFWAEDMWLCTCKIIKLRQLYIFLQNTGEQINRTNQ